MAHSYSNFADAFADLSAQSSVYRTYIEDCYDKCDTADDYANAGNFKWGIRYATYGIRALATALDAIIHAQYFNPDNSWFYESIYWASKEGGDGDLTMSMILDAMWDAEPHQCLLFVPMIDAMRGSIWNKTVTEDWMSQALKHFT